MKIQLTVILVFILLTSACQSRRSPSLYPVKESDSYGYIDVNGELVVPPKFLYASGFSEGYALVVGSDSSLAYLDSQGSLFPVPADLHTVDLPSEGLARAVQDGKVGYLKIPELEWRIAPSWKAAGRFSQGLASVLLPDGEAGYINTKGETLFTLRASALGDFSENRAWFVREGRFGVIDRKGRELVAPQYSWLGDFHESRARARTTEGLYGFLGIDGKWEIPPRFSRAKDFSENKALVYDEDTQNYGYINLIGQMVIPAVFLDGGSFHNGRAWVKQGENFHYIDTQGDNIGDIQLVDAENFSGALAQARDENGLLYLNRNSRIVWHSNTPSSTVTQSSATT